MTAGGKAGWSWVGSLLEIISHVLITRFLKAPTGIRGTQVVPCSRRQLMTNRRLLYIATYSCSQRHYLSLLHTPDKFLPLISSYELDDWKQGHYSCGEEFLVVKKGENFSETFPFPLVSAILLLCSHNTVITVKMTTSIMRRRQLYAVGNCYSAWSSQEYR